MFARQNQPIWEDSAIATELPYNAISINYQCQDVEIKVGVKYCKMNRLLTVRWIMLMSHTMETLALWVVQVCEIKLK